VDTLQVVVGPIADQLAGDIRRACSGRGAPGTVELDIAALAHALGGATNIETVDVRSTRLTVKLRSSASIDVAAIKAAGARGAVAVGDALWHVILGPRAEEAARELRSSSN
jgi:PTS system N-acetylglucosamine-specific IIC component